MKLGKLIKELDTVVGMLLVPSMQSNEVKVAMDKVSTVSFELGLIIDDLD